MPNDFRVTEKGAEKETYAYKNSVCQCLTKVNPTILRMGLFTG